MRMQVRQMQHRRMQSNKKIKLVIDIERDKWYHAVCNEQLWRNWHTRMIQVHVHLRGCGFKSHQLHECKLEAL